MAMKRKTSEVSAKTTALIIDGAYARIHGRSLGGNIDFSRLRTELEEIASTEFDECWYFDSQRRDAPGNSQLASEFHALKYARPRGPQLQVEIYSTKPRSCKCTSCGHKFNQNVQKGVDNGIATKLLTLTLTRNIERVILVSGDGDFYTSLRYVRNELAREVWVVGFLDTVSGDLQQLASQIMWIDEMWGLVKMDRRGRGRLSRTEKPHFSHLRHQPSLRSHRRRHSHYDRHQRRDQARSDYGSPRRERSLPRRELPFHAHDSKRIRRSPSPRRDSEEDPSYSPLFEGVNLSCSGSEVEYSCPSLQASPSPNETGVAQSPPERRFSFPPSPTNGPSSPHHLLDWAFGRNA
ncbi:NYN domain-containing protein [Phytophthora infestans]|uniref:NYN domain-containing protein n=1 Tax=Phytophthora infestans TaxID=4787 RepID=A0A833SZ59_PHYIN|nr:NYN domain-containing protein [Phytophthora infestans]